MKRHRVNHKLLKHLASIRQEQALRGEVVNLPYVVSEDGISRVADHAQVKAEEGLCVGCGTRASADKRVASRQLALCDECLEKWWYSPKWRDLLSTKLRALRAEEARPTRRRR